tara:strand:- start:1492 stop:1689 length:198 start_codon:yes stop_codon:yes gene_type:complete
MSELYIYEKMLKNIRERQDLVTEALCYGPVADFVAFKELRAKLGELATTEQELKLLLNKVSQEND